MITKKELNNINERIKEIKIKLSYLSKTNKFENEERKLLINELFDYQDLLNLNLKRIKIRKSGLTLVDA